MAGRSSFSRLIDRRPVIAQIGVVALFLLIWELAARFVVDRMFLSPPSRVFGEMDRLFATKGVTAALGITLWELAIAFTIAVAIGLVVGLSIGLSSFARRTFFPIVLLLYGTPQITILPLFILYFGIGASSKIAFGVTH